MIRAALDIGARHGDLALWDGSALHLTKHPLSAHTADAALEALDAGLSRFGQDIAALEEIRLCQTWALNAVLARAGQPVTLITTRGFSDILTLARQDRADLYDPVARSPAPQFLVGQVIEIDERIGADGGVVTAPDLTALEGLAEGAVAICLINAHVNGEHELAIAAALPNNVTLLSHQIDPAPREYERCVATCLEAWLHAALAPTLKTFKDGLRTRGFVGTLLFADNTGALSPDPHLSAMLCAGPAMAARAGAGLQPSGPVITADLGSSSLDLALCRDGDVVTCGTSTPGGVPSRRVAADTHSVALGGQSCPLPQGPSVDAALAILGRLPGPKPSDLSENIARQTITTFSRAIGDEVVQFAVARNLDPYDVPLVLMGGLGVVLLPDIANALGLSQIGLAPAAPQAAALALLSAPEAQRAAISVGKSLDRLTASELAQVTRAVGDTPDSDQHSHWTALIAPTAQGEPERVILPHAPTDPAEILMRWQAHMQDQTGVRPAQGTLIGLERTLTRTAPSLPPPPVPDAPPQWNVLCTQGGGMRLERIA